MKNKVLVVLLILSIFSLTGCNGIEKGLMDDVLKIQSINGARVEHKVSVEWKGKSHLGTRVDSLKDVRGVDLFLYGQVRQVPQEGHIFIDYKFKGEENYRPLTDIYMDYEEFHINGLKLLKEGTRLGIMEYPDEMLKEIELKLQNKPYLSIIKEDFAYSEEKEFNRFEVEKRYFRDSVDAIKQGYRFFSGNFISSKNGGYEIIIDAHKFVDLIDRLVVYRDEHKQDMYNITMKLLEIEHLYPDVRQRNKIELEEKMKDKDVFYRTLEEQRKQWEDEGRKVFMNQWRSGDFAQFNMQLSYDQQFKKSVNQSMRVNAQNLGIYVDGETKIYEQNVEFVPIIKYQMLEQFAEEVDKLKEKYRVGQDSISDANQGQELNGNQENENNEGIKNPVVDKIIISKGIYNEKGAVYLDIKEVVKLTGRSMGWDGQQQSAYVLEGKKKLPVISKMIDGTIYVKASELGKMGYRVLDGNSGNTIIVVKK